MIKESEVFVDYILENLTFVIKGWFCQNDVYLRRNRISRPDSIANNSENV